MTILVTGDVAGDFEDNERFSAGNILEQMWNFVEIFPLPLVAPWLKSTQTD